MFLRKYGCIAMLILLQVTVFRAAAQQGPIRRCATMEVLQRSLEKDTALKEAAAAESHPDITHAPEHTGEA